MIRKSPRDRVLLPEPTSAELEKLVADATREHARGGAGVTIRTYVLARTMEVFLNWIRAGEGVRKLQDCKYIGGMEDMRGIGFTSPLVAMVVIEGWERGREGAFVEEGCRLISRYCLDKRVHTVPTDFL